jgi:nitrite reductase/ring-hydroxylating ferredoxin subunit
MYAAPAPIRLCRLEDLPEGGARGFDPLGSGRDSCLAVRQGNRVYTYLNACPHVDGSPLAWRKDQYLNAARSHIVCSGHGALFEIATGVCTLGPCVGDRLKPIENSIDPLGQVHLHFNTPETTAWHPQ